MDESTKLPLFSVEDRGTEKIKLFPTRLLKRVYDKNDSVLFGSRYTKGKVMYNYIDGQYTVDGKPFITDVSMTYDGIGNKNLPEGTIIMAFEDLPKMFPNNQFK